MSSARQIILVLVVSSSLLGAQRADARGRAPFKELRLSGSSYVIGKKHGRRMRRQIRDNVRFYLRLLGEMKMKPAAALRLADKFAPALARHTPELLREIDGIAKGSGRTRAEILLLNARTELFSIAARQLGKPMSPDSSLGTPGCTSVALASKSGKLALGQNWDWRPDQRARSVVLRIKRRGAPDLVTFTEAGMVGKIGFNQHRLGVCLNFLSHAEERSPTKIGVPIHVLLRSAMECKTTAQAARLIASMPRTASANFLIAQQTGKGARAIDLETTPTKVALLRPRGGVLVHANNFKSAKLKAGCDRRADPTTLDRDAAAKHVARSTRGMLDQVARAKLILMNHAQPNPISRTLADRKDPTDGVTVASIVMNLGNERLPFWISGGAPSENRYAKRKARLKRRFNSRRHGQKKPTEAR